MKKIVPLLAALFLSPTVQAEPATCYVKVQHDLEITSNSLKVLTGSQPIYQISEGGKLQIKGEQIDLSPQQRLLAEQYNGDLAALIHQWIELIPGAMDSSQANVEQAFGKAFGDGSDAATQLSQVFARAKVHFENVAYEEDGVYFLDADNYNRLDQDLDSELENDLGAVVSSVQAILRELVRAMASSEGNLGDNMTAFGERMELMGSELEMMGETLGSVRHSFCEQLIEVQTLEQKVAKSIPELAEYPLFLQQSSVSGGQDQP